MRKIIALALAAPLIFGSAAAAEQKGEIAYPENSLGYNALVEADYALAEKQIRETMREGRRDPAKLINLAQALAQQGRNQEAQEVLELAIRSPRHFNLVLSDGSVIHSKRAAEMALARLTQQVASR